MVEIVLILHAKRNGIAAKTLETEFFSWLLNIEDIYVIIYWLRLITKYWD